MTVTGTQCTFFDLWQQRELSHTCTCRCSNQGAILWCWSSFVCLSGDKQRKHWIAGKSHLSLPCINGHYHLFKGWQNIVSRVAAQKPPLVEVYLLLSISLHLFIQYHTATSLLNNRCAVNYCILCCQIVSNYPNNNNLHLFNCIFGTFTQYGYSEDYTLLRFAIKEQNIIVLQLYSVWIICVRAVLFFALDCCTSFETNMARIKPFPWILVFWAVSCIAQDNAGQMWSSIVFQPFVNQHVYLVLQSLSLFRVWAPKGSQLSGTLWLPLPPGGAVRGGVWRVSRRIHCLFWQ